MKFIAVFYLLASGCLLARPVSEPDTWSVSLGNWETPLCVGELDVGKKQWHCGSFGTDMSADARRDGRVFFDLEMSPGFFTRVRAEFTGPTAIDGDFLLNDRLVEFRARLE